MAGSRSRLRVLLIQVRDTPAAVEQERLCFLRRCRIGEHQMRVHNVLDEPLIRPSVLAGADAVMIGGAGAHSVTQNYPFMRPLREVVERAIESGLPLFGSCWGHQFLAQQLGGRVIEDRTTAEVGTFEIERTAAGRADPLTAGLPDRFAVQLGHNDRVAGRVPGTVVLARSERCAYQLFRLADKPVYGSQFHSEMTAEDMRVRVRMYKDVYLSEDDPVEAFESRLRPSPAADRLLDRFLDLYC